MKLARGSGCQARQQAGRNFAGKAFCELHPFVVRTQLPAGKRRACSHVPGVHVHRESFHSTQLLAALGARLRKEGLLGGSGCRFAEQAVCHTLGCGTSLGRSLTHTPVPRLPTTRMSRSVASK